MKPHARTQIQPQFPTLILNILTLSLITVHSQSNLNDSDVMHVLKSHLKPLGWTDPNPCNWDHVTCSQDNRVTRIQLGNLNLKGSLPQTLNNLTQLQILELQFNKLTGPLPSLTGLTQLQNLLINNNNFTSIPYNFFDGMSSLQSVYLDYNAFNSWHIPYTLKMASNLHTFSATSTNLTGKIPNFFGSNTFTGLITLRLAFNYLEGGLPTTLSGSLIQTLWLNSQKSSFKLNGSIEVLQNMTQLTEVWLHGNLFSGPVPQIWGLNQLHSLSLRDNRLTGPVPPSITGSHSLKVVNLTNNMFQGAMPKFSESVSVDMFGIDSFCSQVPAFECDSRVNLLIAVAESVGYPLVFAQKWKGNDPCNSWLGITCSSGGEITTVNFRNMNLSGSISSNFSSISSLQRLVLADNNLSGVIPDGLKDLHSLVEIDVSNNRLYGEVPSFRLNVTVVSYGNPKMERNESVLPPVASPVGGEKIGFSDGGDGGDGGDQRTSGGGGGGGGGGVSRGGDGSDSGSGGPKTGLIIGCFSGGVGAVLLIGLMGYCVYRLKSKRPESPVNDSTPVIDPGNSGSEGDRVKITVTNSDLENRSHEINNISSAGPTDNAIELDNFVIPIQLLKTVTNNFSPSNILGRGGFGTVYRGDLHDGTKIAVKRMERIESSVSVTCQKSLDKFLSEVQILTKVRHKHLVALLGYCLEGNERLLVFEYMPQGTLSRFLFNREREDLSPLDWTTRLLIALDVSRGVEYLHGLARQSFIHRDLKPSNILLGDDMRAKVADFGLVRLAPEDKTSAATQLAGTFGYLAPEYAATGRVTTKIDVFSFGVILMELITGRKAIEETQPEESILLVRWFKKMHINKETFRKAIDPSLEPFLDEPTLASVTMVAELAGHCCTREPYQRPDMYHAVSVLSYLNDFWKPAESDPEDMYGVDLSMSLPQALQRWQGMEGMTGVDPLGYPISTTGENRF